VLQINLRLEVLGALAQEKIGMAIFVWNAPEALVIEWNPNGENWVQDLCE
jgi:hypothetical protein